MLDSSVGAKMGSIKRLVAIGAVFVGSLATVGGANAAPATVGISGSVLTVTGNGSDNFLVLQGGATGQVSVQSQTVTNLQAGSGCRPVTSLWATCNRSGLTEVRMNGGGGNDGLSAAIPSLVVRINGEGGSDRYLSSQGSAVISGGDGNDGISAGSGIFAVVAPFWVNGLTGGPGKDTIDGSPSGDSINGGPQKDTIRASGGNDLIDSKDGVAESVICGNGTDTIGADPNDSLTACENRL